MNQQNQGLDAVIPTSVQLNAETFATGLQVLSAGDPDLAQVISAYGPPPLWRREPGFATLVSIILEQQVSVASARSVFNRVVASVAPFSAPQFLRADDDVLKRAGLSRQKLSYCKNLAEAVVTGQLRLQALHAMTDEDIRTALMAIKGIGRWTADVYLLLALGRADIFPTGDLALVVAVKELKKLEAIPSPSALDVLGAGWRPWRAVATRILWHYYVSTR